MNGYSSDAECYAILWTNFPAPSIQFDVQQSGITLNFTTDFLCKKDNADTEFN